MAIEQSLLEAGIDSIAGIEGVCIDATVLVEDIFLLSLAFNGKDDFLQACESTCQALRDVVNERVDASRLKYDLQGWKSYHYQSHRAQGNKADCRIVYRKRKDGIEVKGFGHRRIPADFYRRMMQTR